MKEERERIRKRQREEIDAALQNGISFGQPKAELNEEFVEITIDGKSGEMTAIKAMKEAGVKKITFYKPVKEYEEVLKIISN